jgi:multiple sugar transport system ATP-binding protein
LTAGVRAEDLRLGEPPPGFGFIRGQVDAVEPLGAETLVLLSGPGFEVTARLGRTVAVRVGEAATLHFDPAALHVFDPDTTRAVAPDL